MKRTCKLLLPCLLLLVLLCSCAPKATVFLEPVSTPRDVDLTHELYEESYLGSTFYAKKLEELDGEYIWSGWADNSYRYFLADVPYEEQNITSAQQAYEYFMSLDREAMQIPQNYVVFQFSYDPTYDVWWIWTCHEENFDEHRGGMIVDDGVWTFYLRGNGQMLYRGW